MSSRNHFLLLLPFLCSQSVVTRARSQFARAFSVENTYRDRERAQEAVYFNKEEERTLRQLAAKLMSARKATDPKEYEKLAQKEKDDIKKIVGDKLSADQLEALRKWKHYDH